MTKIALGERGNHEVDPDEKWGHRKETGIGIGLDSQS
jgi:hypothetical protein